MIEPTDEMARAFKTAERAYWAALNHEAVGMTVAEHGRAATLQGLAAVLEIVERERNDGLDVIDVVPSLTANCLSLQCAGCGWTRHVAPGHPGGRALAHLTDLAVSHARDVDHGGPS